MMLMNDSNHHNANGLPCQQKPGNLFDRRKIYIIFPIKEQGTMLKNYYSKLM